MMVSCSLVAYGHPLSMLERAIASAMNSPVQIGLTVVDNLGDPKLEKACKKWRVNYLNPGKNLGFGAAHNLILQKMSGHANFHLVLNPDVEFGPEVIPALIEAHKKLANPGLVAPLITYPDGSIQHLCKLTPSPFDLFARRFIPGFLRALWKRRFAAYEMRNFDYSNTLRVPILSGCFTFFRDEVYQRIGGFDERFFLYLEDVDLSRRVGKTYINWHYPHVRIVHHYQKGSYKNLNMLKLHLTSAFKYFNKWGWVADRERKRQNRLAQQANKEKKLILSR